LVGEKIPHWSGDRPLCIPKSGRRWRTGDSDAGHRPPLKARPSAVAIYKSLPNFLILKSFVIFGRHNSPPLAFASVHGLALNRQPLPITMVRYSEPEKISYFTKTPIQAAPGSEEALTVARKMKMTRPSSRLHLATSRLQIVIPLGMKNRHGKNNGLPGRELQCIYTALFERRGEYGSLLGVLSMANY
jgi:hypothetical protein